MLTDTEPAWIDVLIDMLMSCLSHDDNLVRVVVNTSFTILTPQLTNTSLQLIVNVSFIPHH